MKLLLLISFIFCSCAVNVKKDYDQEFDFSKLRSYAWVQTAPDPNNQSLDTLVKKRIHSNVNRILLNKGLKETSKQEADFLIDYMYRSREVTVPSVIQPSVGVGYGFNRSAFGGLGVGFGSVREREIEVLRINILSPDSKALLWTGMTEDTDLKASSPSETSKNFKRALEAILESFPPTGKND